MIDKEEFSIAAVMLSRLEDLGRCQAMLKEALKAPLFDNLSKHNSYWDCDDSEEASDKLYDIRVQLSLLEDKLWDIEAILGGRAED